MADLVTITVVRKPAKDKYGDRPAGGAVEFDVPGCQFAPGVSHEQNFGAQQVTGDATVYAPAGTKVLATDQVRYLGDLYDVAGRPDDWGAAGYVIVLKYSTG